MKEGSKKGDKREGGEEGELGEKSWDELLGETEAKSLTRTDKTDLVSYPFLFVRS